MHDSSRPGDQVDLRVKRTRKLLRDALVALIDEKGFDKISISEIADRAMINRATFYRHFRDKADLLVRCMDDIFEDLEARIVPPLDASGQPQMQAPMQNILMLFEHVNEHAAFYRVMLGKGGSSLFHMRVREVIKAIASRRLTTLGGRFPDVLMSATETDMLAHFGAATLIGLIMWWVENEQPYSPTQMAGHAITLVTQGAYGIYKLPPNLVISA